MNMRPATTHDSDFLLRLKNDPVMRQFSVVTHEKIKKSDHERWLKNHLDEIQIVMEGRHKIGMFRVNMDKEVSINLHPSFRGQGFGQKVLENCPKGVWAKIVAGNIASLNLFMHNGFKIVDYLNDLYYLEN